MALTEKRIAKLKEPGRYGDGNRSGLYVQVKGPKNRSWIMRYERDGRERWMGLGSLTVFNLQEARERARRARQQIADGIDPLDARVQERAQRALLEAARSITFEKAATAYYNAHEASWKSAKHAAQFVSTLRDYAFPKIGKLPVADIETGQVLKCIEPIWQKKTETASRVRGRIEAVLDWATVRGYRKGDNPARWKGHLSETLPSREKIQKVVHHAALPFADLPAFMAELKQREGIAARALEFTILTAARTGEVIGATWDEFDPHGSAWIIPAERMKAKVEHRVPLSARALEILNALLREEGNPFVFPGPQRAGLSNMAMASVLRRMKHDKITVHGMRSVFRDWAAERTNYPSEVVEQALAHTVGSKVERAYRRSDVFAKRARLMDEWARFCTTAPTQASATVVSIRKA
jgi:integrase